MQAEQELKLKGRGQAWESFTARLCHGRRAETLKGCEFRHVFLTEKQGDCPQERVICEANAPDLCRDDLTCDGQRKCCFFACGKKCIDLHEGIGSLAEVPLEVPYFLLGPDLAEQFPGMAG